MTQQEHEAAVAAFIRARGVTRCPTVCAAPTQASLAESDRAVLRQRAAEREATRLEQYRHAFQRRFAVAA
jgi:hypothetical protein